MVSLEHKVGFISSFLRKLHRRLFCVCFSNNFSFFRSRHGIIKFSVIFFRNDDYIGYSFFRSFSFCLTLPPLLTMDLGWRLLLRWRRRSSVRRGRRMREVGLVWESRHSQQLHMKTAVFTGQLQLGFVSIFPVSGKLPETSNCYIKV